MWDSLFDFLLLIFFAGVFINEILSNMKQKANDSSTFERRMNVYSASDRVMLNLWQGMNITKRIFGVPPCGAALIIELHEIDSEYRVKVSSMTLIRTLSIRSVRTNIV